MKKMKVILGITALTVAGFFMVAADHIDAPAVQGGTSDITDYYAFQGQDTDNVVFVANVQGLLSPTASASAAFDENVIVEFNIDTNADAVEDLVIQAVARDGKMYFFGPTTPATTGLNSTILTDAPAGDVDITSYTSSSPTIGTNAGMSFFAGPRDDPFFMDFTRFVQILTPGDDTGDGMEETAFLPQGEATDTFAGSNVMSIVVEVPKAMLGGGTSINTWVESKRKQ